jgi:hypothetical protein
VNAEFNDGMLKVHIAKSESARPKQIEVEAATGNAAFPAAAWGRCIRGFILANA